MNMIKKISILLLIMGGNTSYADDFTPYGSFNFTQTFYGNAGAYKTKTAHPAIVADYHFSPQWSTKFEWDRTWNMFDYTGAEKQQNNSYSAPEIAIYHHYGTLKNSKIDWSSALLIKYENDFNDESQTFVFAQTNFDFADYIPKKDYLNITQLTITPMYYYGWNNTGPSGHTNTAVLGLLTSNQITSDLSFIFNAYTLRSWNQGASFLTNSDNHSETANYLAVFSYLNYDKELHKFNDQTSMNFNFTMGLDPWISSNKNTSVEPFLISDEMDEWMSPTIFEGTYKNTFVFFTMPQLALNYTFSKDATFNLFVQAKYSNQVWGNQEKAWRIQPQGGFGLTYNF